MSRNLRLALLTATAAFASLALPPILPAPMALGLSGAAHAGINTPLSNIKNLRMKQTIKQSPAAKAVTVKSSKSNSSERTTIHGSKSNGCDRAGSCATIKLNSSRSNIY